MRLLSIALAIGWFWTLVLLVSVTGATSKVQPAGSSDKPWKATDTSAVAAVVVAVAALGISLWQGYVVHKHNKHSVRPHLRCDITAVPGEDLSIVLVNTGVGPAVVTKFQLGWDDVPLGPAGNEKVKQLLAALELGRNYYEYFHPFAGDFLAPGENFVIIKLRKSREHKSGYDRDEIEQLRPKLDRIRWELAYESIYQDRFVCRPPTSLLRGR